ncbi:glycoside hydrolase domain-containing protein [Neobacillus niacini]|uniref:glycoside hydrolase domain-containing protein n=1 Tax=Neobacillus niacini TaxID=86668 RepID=UPI00286032E0|nr:glycoside hydrolase domain-containing protein [Neobacillus niacini]MDR7001365.1 LysM repeat protein [Neobacillus niacini]
MTRNGFDCATKLTAATAKNLKDAGFSYVARYLGNSWKTFDAAEAKVIQEVGLKLISIAQKSANYPGYHTKAQGIADAMEAERCAKLVGQPVGSAIYFAVDFDVQACHMKGILDYVEGLNSTLKDYKVGLYGSYVVMMAVKDKVDYYWQTFAWSNGKVADHIHKHQYQNDVKVAGIAIDKNDIKKDPGAWGEVAVPKRKTPKPTAAIKEDDIPEIHIVIAGENLTLIGRKYGLSIDDLAKLNHLANPDVIYAGQPLRIKRKVPSVSKPDTYIIKKGDTFWDLEKVWGMKHGTLNRVNPEVNPERLQPGQKIRMK